MADFLDALRERVLVFDGAAGTNLQGVGLTVDDFGGVVVQKGWTAAGEDTAADAARWEFQPGTEDVVAQLVTRCRGHVWIVSKAYPKMQLRTLGFLDQVGFYERTGMRRENVRFCLERVEKKIHCEELGITHFVDDKIPVLQALQHTVPNLYRFEESAEAPYTPGFASHVTSWQELLAILG